MSRGVWVKTLSSCAGYCVFSLRREAYADSFGKQKRRETARWWELILAQERVVAYKDGH